MKTTHSQQRGFGAIELFLILVVVAVLVAAGGYVYYRQHKSNTTGSTSQTNNTTPNPQPDLYAGWKQYCDSTYHYCFKYPSNWALTDNANAHGIRLLSPTQTVNLTYSIGQPQSSSVLTFTPRYNTKLMSANEDLTIVGGYTQSVSGQYFMSYQVVDSSLLSKYPLTIGTSSQFSDVPSFTVKGTNYLGSLSVAPVKSLNSVVDVRNWIDATDSKTSLLILQSFVYQQ